MKVRYRFKSARFKRFNHRLQVQEMKQAVGLYQKKRLIRRNWKHITVQNNDENNVFANEKQNSENNTAECADERAALANLIANLTLDTEENKTILKQLKKANASLTQELEECRTNLDETSRAVTPQKIGRSGMCFRERYFIIPLHKSLENDL
ncbi:hypothetical protein Tco_1339639 [Tanacetum coccineum]